ncbi:MAG: glycine cleavage system aminomethyltransferase GcvT [Endomicrobium sp.]|jgi:aminomethyltransferase|nr:glycine cleavage system aminomethyltransferase GcvT [Endomicrobium sp.]
MKRTYLYDSHLKLGAKMTEFGGWEMPVQYSSIIEEHNAIRNGCGVFDTSHMGTFIISGKDSGDFLNKVTVSDMKNLADKKAKYSMILNENGGIKDDIIVYNLGNEYMMVVNAGNLDKDWQWLNKFKSGETELRNISADICLLALQGPKAAAIAQSLFDTNIENLKYFSCSPLKLKNMDASFCAVARTGYTGEDGFEIFISREQSKILWDKFIELGVKPCGLGCRDTLRLEACMPLHGHEIDENINPIDAGFEKIIYWKNDFIGKGKLLEIKNFPSKKSVAYECAAGIARGGNKVFYEGKEIGYVTSGTFSPTLKKAIGLALIDSDICVNEIEIEIHNNRRKAAVVNKPFYKRVK